MLRHDDSQLRETIVRTAKTHQQLLAIVALLLLLQFYFVRELIAAEFLFGGGFVVFLILAGILYVVGAVGERSLEWSEAGAKVIAHSTHRIYNRISPVIGRLPDEAAAAKMLRRPDGRFVKQSG